MRPASSTANRYRAAISCKDAAVTVTGSATPGMASAPEKRRISAWMRMRRLSAASKLFCRASIWESLISVSILRAG